MPPEPTYRYVKGAPASAALLQRIRDVMQNTPLERMPQDVYLIPDTTFAQLKARGNVEHKTGLALSNLSNGSMVLPFGLDQPGEGFERVVFHELAHFNDPASQAEQMRDDDKYNRLADQLLRLYKLYKPLRQRSDEAFRNAQLVDSGGFGSLVEP